MLYASLRIPGDKRKYVLGSPKHTKTKLGNLAIASMESWVEDGKTEQFLVSEVMRLTKSGHNSCQNTRKFSPFASYARLAVEIDPTKACPERYCSKAIRPFQWDSKLIPDVRRIFGLEIDESVLTVPCGQVHLRGSHAAHL